MYNEKDYIIVKGCRQHNLKNVDVFIPKGKLVVVTGLSGSGKSSLAFDTVYAEGQRKYVESLSAYARQFVGRMDKPDVDSLLGLVPSIAIEQKSLSSNSRSTVGTSTEIYDYLKILFARIGETISPVSGKKIIKHTVSDVVDFIKNSEATGHGLVMAPLKMDEHLGAKLKNLLQSGFQRVYQNNEVHKIEELSKKKVNSKKQIYLVVERFSLESLHTDSLADSIQIAFEQGFGYCSILLGEDLYSFSNYFEEDGVIYEEPSVNMFTFNNPFGACKTCEGFGSVVGIDEDLVIPDKTKSIYNGAVVAWRGEKMSAYLRQLISGVGEHFPIHTPYCELSATDKDKLWYEEKEFVGIYSFFEILKKDNYKIQNRVFISRFTGKTICWKCKGTRLRADAAYVKMKGYSIQDLVLKPIEELASIFETLPFNEYEKTVSKFIIPEISTRLKALNDLGLGYLTLNRVSRSLSGGESQRIKIAALLGGGIVGAAYVLDEPSIGLHCRDTAKLISVLQQLRDLGNTIIVVEHDEEIMRHADYIIDIGPKAGYLGGEVMYQGLPEDIFKAKESLTAQYLSKELEIKPQEVRSKSKQELVMEGATKNNLKNISFSFPLNRFVVVCGVSGSGKTTLIKEELHKRVSQAFFYRTHSDYDKLDNKIHVPDALEAIEMVDQQAIGTSSRSNTATYTKMWDHIREFMATLPPSKAMGLSASSFSFNVEEGRCEVCQGEGTVLIEMQFLSDIHLTCEACKGRRFKEHILEVEYKNKNISDILNMTVDELVDFFDEKESSHCKKLQEKLSMLQRVGLGYITIGQSSATFSGGEAQRLKLSTFLMKGAGGAKTLFIFDEPTTGLHFHDINKLLKTFDALIEKGHSVLVIEHQLDVVNYADYVVELGPEGGEKGGRIVFSGTPQELKKKGDTATGRLLAKA